MLVNKEIGRAGREKILGRRQKRERNRQQFNIFQLFRLYLDSLCLNFLSSLTGVRHDDPGQQCAPLEADSLVSSKVRETHPQSLTQSVLCNRALSPGLNLLHGGSAWHVNHSLHP